MDEIKWIKIVTDVFDNRKIKQIECMPDGDALLIIWFKLLTLAGQINDGGLVYFTRDIPYTDQLLSSQFNKPIATVQLALQTFERFGMIEIVDSVIMVSNWEKYQSIEGMDRVREQTRKRVASYRERQKQKLVTLHETFCNGAEKEIEVDKEKEKRVAKATQKKIFVPPTVDEVRAYCEERNNNIDPETFVDFYQSKGWMVGRNKMKDWKSAVRTWERSRRTEQPQSQPRQETMAERLERLRKEGRIDFE